MAFKLENIPQKNSYVNQESNSIEDLLKKEIILFGVSFNNTKKQVFYQELSVLLMAGITIKEALTLIIESLKKINDKELVQKILDKVINGKSFSQSLSESKIFTEYEYYSIKIGEETGTVSKVCKDLKLFFERKNDQKRIIIAALTYPSIVLSTAFFVIIFMLGYVVPMFEDIFKQNKMELPYITQVIVKLSAITKTYGLFILLTFALILICLNFFKKNKKLQSFLNYNILKIPILGSFILKVYIAQFTQAITLLTTAKVPILNSIQMVKRMIQFIPLQDALEKVEANILQGKNLSDSLKMNKLFDNRMISFVKVAEETNQTENVFKQLSEQYNLEVIQQSKAMTTILEPLIILVVGVIVAVLLIAMYLPMFQLGSAIN